MSELKEDLIKILKDTSLVDKHTHFAAKIYKVSPEQVTKEQRYAAKGKALELIYTREGTPWE